MDNKLLQKYDLEKQAFVNFLIVSRMSEIRYNETFNLIFRKDIRDEISGNWISRELILIIDTSCWLGEKDIWYENVKNQEVENEIFEREDALLAYELVKLRSCNLIEVKSVTFLDEFLQISFDGGLNLSIAYYSESDYSWILEDLNNEDMSTRMMIFCQGNELFMKNIPNIL